MDNVVAGLRYTGSEFHSLGARTATAWPPAEVRRYVGTQRRVLLMQQYG